MSNVKLSECVMDNTAEGLFKVHHSVFTDSDILETEKERIFSKCWVYVGHASEIEKPGQYVTRNVVGHPIIMIRDADQQIRVFLNTCSHQGSMLCRLPSGQSNSLQCFFHGWTFDLKGELIGVPGSEGYGGKFNTEDHHLSSPAKVDHYHGFVFMNFDPTAISLPDYLAGAKEYIDLIADQADEFEIVPGTQEYSTKANWKMLSMNSMDGYHVQTTHVTYFKFLQEEGVDLKSRHLGRRLDLGNGHSAAEFYGGWGRPVARWAPPFPKHLEEEIEAKKAELEGKFDPERVKRIVDSDFNLFIFPNLAIHDHSAISIRTYRAVSPDHMEVTARTLAPKGESEEMRAARLKNFLTFFGPAGFSTPDDIEALELIQRGFKNAEAEWTDVSKGALAEIKRDVPGGGADELQLRAFWRQWKAYMETESV